MDVAATFCATLVDEWHRAGVVHAAAAPGSRSTPLLLALRAHENLRLHVFVDERSAAFFALGIGLATNRPAVVLTTSGTAAAELLPAVIEAHHAGVPLIVCTADRPPESQGVGAPQTIDQARLYGATLRWRADPGVPDVSAAGSWRSLAARAVCEARGVGGRPGPVHLNLPFREPLVGRPGSLPPARSGETPWHQVRRSPACSPSTVSDVTELVANRRGLIVAGAGGDDPDGIQQLAASLGWPVLADPRSGCRRSGSTTVAAFDSLLRHRTFADELTPEVVIRAGGPPASRVLAEWLTASGAEQIVVDTHGTWVDPERNAAVVVAADPGALCRAVAGRRPAPCPPPWLDTWACAEAAAQGAIDEVLGRHAEPTEPGVARTLFDWLPSEATLFVSSSMPVRDLEWFARPRPDVRVLANRGANGIDGIVSTVLGVAAARPGSPTAGLVGDLALLHDGGGLLGAARRDVSCVLVVVDNDGGGIFSFLPQSRAVDKEDFDCLFTVPHGLDLARLARLHGLASCEVVQAHELGPAVRAGFDARGVNVIVARTERRSNVVVHDEIHAAVASSLEAAGHRAA
jgi:2-succinyl-5-enolpyruvyl-6-hydroxy-3-cyclohexene-1-carboxylate synthase